MRRRLCRLTGLFALIVALTTRDASSLDVLDFERQIRTLANDILGVQKFQDYVDENVQTRPVTDTIDERLENLVRELAFKIKDRIQSVRDLRDKIVEEFGNLQSEPNFEDCCQCCNQEADRANYLKFLTKNVDVNSKCYFNQGRLPSPDFTFTNDAILEVMKTNLRENPTLKWQYYGGEDGVMNVYPGAKGCGSIDTYDNRYRPWYSQAALPTPKDLVIVIDRSGSMMQFHDNRVRMDIAKEAASTVISTLNADDRIGVVYFSDLAETPGGTCHSSRLAHASADNQRILKEFIMSGEASGQTNYTVAFEAAFGLFLNSDMKPQFDSRERLRLIMFLTDGEPDDDNYLDVISSRNAELNNSVVITTFAFGTVTSRQVQILTDISKQIKHDRSAGNIRAGNFQHVKDPDTLRYHMARYYTFFQDESSADNITITIPYLDALGLGLLTSICYPIYYLGEFKGVTCIDVTLSDLFSEVADFSQSDESYAIIMDGQTRLHIHPLLSRPEHINDPPAILRLPDLEDTEGIQSITDSILRGQNGSMSLTSTRILSRGVSDSDGVNRLEPLESRYIWRHLGVADLVLCLVVAEADVRSERTVASLGQLTFPYHRLDLTEPPGLCRYLERLAVTWSDTVKFAPFAFESPVVYLQSPETESLVSHYEEFFLGSNEAGFQEFVKAAFEISASFEGNLDRSESVWKTSVWRYLGLRNGVFRVYPGNRLTNDYDHTLRPWYKRAVSRENEIVFSKPYVDAFGAGVVLTLAQAVLIPGVGSADIKMPLGVMGLDFTIDSFVNMVPRLIPSCQQNRCFVIDDAGYIIAHADFQHLRDVTESVHVSQREEYVASELVEQNVLRPDYCINHNRRQIQTFYRVSQKLYSSANFEMREVRGTNIFVIEVFRETPNGGCQCAERQESSSVIECLPTSPVCECPCYSNGRLQYNQCTGKFQLDGERGPVPPCAPPAPMVDTTSLLEDEAEDIKSMDFCYPVEEVCPAQQLETNCSATPGCIWCDANCNVNTRSACLPDTTTVTLPGDFNGTTVGPEAECDFFCQNKLLLIIVPVVTVLVIVVVILAVLLVKKRRRHPHDDDPYATVGDMTAPPPHPGPPPYNNKDPDYMTTNFPRPTPQGDEDDVTPKDTMELGDLGSLSGSSNMLDQYVGGERGGGNMYVS